MKKLMDVEVIGKSFKLGLCDDTWYCLEYEDKGKFYQTIQYGTNVEKACQKANIDWLGRKRRVKCG